MSWDNFKTKVIIFSGNYFNLFIFPFSTELPSMQSKKLIDFYAFLWIITVFSKKLSVQVVLGSEIASISPRYRAVHKLCKTKEEGGFPSGVHVIKVFVPACSGWWDYASRLAWRVTQPSPKWMFDSVS